MEGGRRGGVVAVRGLEQPVQREQRGVRGGRAVDLRAALEVADHRDRRRVVARGQQRLDVGDRQPARPHPHLLAGDRVDDGAGHVEGLPYVALREVEAAERRRRSGLGVGDAAAYELLVHAEQLALARGAPTTGEPEEGEGLDRLEPRLGEGGVRVGQGAGALGQPRPGAAVPVEEGQGQPRGVQQPPVAGGGHRRDRLLEAAPRLLVASPGDGDVTHVEQQPGDVPLLLRGVRVGAQLLRHRPALLVAEHQQHAGAVDLQPGALETRWHRLRQRARPGHPGAVPLGRPPVAAGPGQRDRRLRRAHR